eukprot:CAMPEP_0194136760 /NCGR_PEP_ID=MMETSP0152-20130528/6765_1 /TAXON_ID=1049557 /ORGANISM="Thalassiothrix antarctica, Strain L6-D1" /LENGTH=316 /DNA_ID=CAMNT_0038833553 /DNA_START=78 /DNA_END=1028 /DNA_ORIENTATION=+
MFLINVFHHVALITLLIITLIGEYSYVTSFCHSNNNNVLHPSFQQRFERTTTCPATTTDTFTNDDDTIEKKEVTTTIEVVLKMPDPLPNNLKNEYYMLRHGQSTANVAGIISSSRSLAYTKKHGLTPLGYQQGIDSAEQLVKLLTEEEKEIVFVSSPFARAMETAQACLDGLRNNTSSNLKIDSNIRIEEDLMERYFGKLDGEVLSTYGYVWPVDMFNVTSTVFGVESVAAVAARLRRAILKLDREYEDSAIVLVSHADVLQICQLYGANADNVGLFSSYRFGNGEVRKMQRTPESLPEPKPLPPPAEMPLLNSEE